MSIADKLGFGPTRVLVETEDKGYWKLIVTPGSLSGVTESSTLRLNEDQVKRYKEWLDGDGLIQDIFPEFSIAEREIIMSGLSEKEFNKMYPGEEDEDKNDPSVSF